MFSLRYKLILLVFPLFLFYGISQNISINNTVIQGFRQIENDDSIRYINQVQQALSRELSAMADLCRDWATWDDTFQFAQDGNSQYLDKNLDSYYVSELGLHLFLVIDNQGEVVWGKGFDIETGEQVPLTTIFPQASNPFSPLIIFEQSDLSQQINTGYLSTSRGILFVASRPIVRSDSSGPPVGTLVMGRYLDPEKIETLRNQTQIPFELIPVSAFETDSNLASLRPDLLTAGSRVMKIYSEDIDIIERFDDVSGEMLFAIKVIYSRRIMAEGVKIANESLIESGIIGVVLLIGIWIGGRILILHPLQKMTNYVRDYKENRISKNSLIVNRNDEIGLLSRAYDQMLTRIQSQRTQLEVLNQELEVISRTDSLTKLSNRRSFDEILDKELLILRRQHKEKHLQACLSLLVCDIDYFKQYNDTYGHQAGDQVLTEVAGALMNSIRRPADFVCRYGGEEFAILLPDTTEQGAKHVAELIIDEVNHLNIEHKSSPISSHITISVGGSCILADTDLDQLSLFSRADNALYTAKQKGRNRIDFISCNHN